MKDDDEGTKDDALRDAFRLTAGSGMVVERFEHDLIDGRVGDKGRIAIPGRFTIPGRFGIGKGEVVGHYDVDVELIIGKLGIL